MNKKMNKGLSARNEADSSTNADKKHVSQHSRKPNVVCSQSQPMITINGLQIFKGCRVDEGTINLKKKAIVQALQQIGLCHAFEFLSHDTVP